MKMENSRRGEEENTLSIYAYILYTHMTSEDRKIVESEETSITRQRLGKHVPAEEKQRDDAVARAPDSR
jgi:hypothetical protein